MLAFGAGRNRQVRDPPHKVLPSFGAAPEARLDFANVCGFWPLFTSSIYELSPAASSRFFSSNRPAQGSRISGRESAQSAIVNRQSAIKLGRAVAAAPPKHQDGAAAPPYRVYGEEATS